MLIFDGKPTRYRTLYSATHNIKGLRVLRPFVEIDNRLYMNARVSFSTRPSGRRVIWVSTEDDDEFAIKRTNEYRSCLPNICD